MRVRDVPKFGIVAFAVLAGVTQGSQAVAEEGEPGNPCLQSPCRGADGWYNPPEAPREGTPGVYPCGFWTLPGHEAGVVHYYYRHCGPQTVCFERKDFISGEEHGRRDTRFPMGNGGMGHIGTTYPMKNGVRYGMDKFSFTPLNPSLGEGCSAAPDHQDHDGDGDRSELRYQPAHGSERPVLELSE